MSEFDFKKAGEASWGKAQKDMEARGEDVGELTAAAGDLLDEMTEAAVKEFEKSQLSMALEIAKQAHELCIAAEVPDAVLAAAGELVELLEAWAKETGVR